MHLPPGDTAAEPAMQPPVSADEVRMALEQRQRELAELLSGAGERAAAERLQAALAEVEREQAGYTEALQSVEDERRALTREHALRRALLEDPSAADFVRGDLQWLRLVLLLYGGSPVSRMAAYYTQYIEIAAVLQLSDSVREGFINNLRRRPYWREGWDGDDVVYNLAVYLDTECGTGYKAAQRSAPAFDPVFICLDTVLTSFLLPRLRNRVPGEVLLAPLLEIARTRDDPMRCASALLGALAVDPAAAYDDLVQLSRDPSRRGVVRVLLNLLRQRLDLLGDAVVLHSASGVLQPELGHLDGFLPSEKWEDALSVFIRSACMVLPGPPQNLDLVPWMHRPYANAELWARWMSGVGDDAKYSFAVVLDTIGKRIHSADAVANFHRTEGTRFQDYTTWYLDPVPPVWTDTADLFGDSVTIAQESRSVALEELLPIGLMCRSGVRWDEAPHLRTDALAATLLLADAQARSVLEELEPDLAVTSRAELEHEIVERVLRISDPVIHARALWRISQRLAYWGNLNLLDAAVNAAGRIGLPLQRARALERLIEGVPPSMRAALLQRLEAAVRDIPDADNRVRALCRLALLSPREQGERLFREAVGALSSVPGDAQRVNTLVLMRNVLLENALSVEALDEIAETEADPWYRHKAMGLLSFELAGLHSVLEQPVHHAPVVLHALVADTIGLLERNQESDDRWWRLANREQREAAFEMLLADIARTDDGMLPFTPVVHSSMNALAADGGIDLAAELLPHLALSRARVVPELHAWLENPAHPSFRSYASLMAAENGQLEAAMLPQVLELLQHGKDIVRYRAALVLHSDQVFIGKSDPRHRASVLGLDGILRIGEFSIQMREQGRLGASNSARWTWVNVVFDDPGILDGLVGVVLGDPGQRKAASQVLGTVYNLSESARTRLVELVLAHREGPAAEPLLLGLCSASHKQLKFTVPERYQEELAVYWRSLPAPLDEVAQGLPDRIASVAGVITECVERAGGAVAPATLEAALQERYIRAPESSPEQIGACGTYWLTADPPKAHAAAQGLAESAAALRSLFTWLRAVLAEPVGDVSPFVRRRDTLLEIAGSCGRHSPATVFNLIDELDLQDALATAAMLDTDFNARAGAVTLLGYSRTPGRGFLAALKSAMTDTAEVQQAALATLRRLRYVDLQLLSELIDTLRSDDAVLTYAASRLLSVMARHEKTGDDERKAIFRALSSALRDRRARHSVCAFEHVGGKMWISRTGTLAQRHYQSLLEIVSIS
jgi:hypothetical protein